MAAMTSLINEVKDITECSICTEMFCHSKMLPCFHTFCLECLQQYGAGKEDGDVMSCPMCRKEFNVPMGGLSKLGANFFVDRLITAQSAAVVSQHDVEECDICLTGKQLKVGASSFCKECHENLCDACSQGHKHMKTAMFHQISQLDVSANVAEEGTSRKHFCDKHTTEEMKFYCHACQGTICTTCCIAKHNRHDVSEIDDAVKDIKIRLKGYYENASKLFANIKEQSERVNEQIRSFKLGIGNAEKKILARNAEIKQQADRQGHVLLEKLNSRKLQILKIVNASREKLDRNMTICESFMNYCLEVIEEADALEIVRISEELKTRFEEMKAQSMVEFDIQIPEIGFLPPDQNSTTSLKRFGTIYENFQLLEFVKGISILNNKLYIVRRQSIGIDVYDTDKLKCKRKIPVNDLIKAYDMVAHGDAIFVSESDDKWIHRIYLPEGNCSKWSLNSKWLTMSTTKKGNILVSCYDLCTIIEYTSLGKVVREIKTNDESITCLRHAIQLDDDRFMICHTSTKTQRVCLIDSRGKPIRSYGGKPESGIGQLNFPCYLAMDGNGSILVADRNNDRILQTNASLGLLERFVPESFGLQKPREMFVDRNTKRLYLSRSDDPTITLFHV